MTGVQTCALPISFSGAEVATPTEPEVIKKGKKEEEGAEPEKAEKPEKVEKEKGKKK